MQGDIWLDEYFETGIKGRPGSRIVIDLKKSPSLSDAKENSMLISTRALSDDAFLEEGWAPLPTSLNILFVDDDRILRKLGVRTLAKLVPSWNVQEASSGETALQLLKTESFDIIFMDQYMASSSGQALKGTETIRALRAEGVTSIVCGLSANNLEANFKDAGANDFILKPFPCKKDELIPVLRSLLSTRPL
jgi:CheY-like chemotaxis protein